MIAKIAKYGANFYGVLAYAESKKESLSKDEQGEDRPGFERLSVNNFNDGRHFFSSKMELCKSLETWSGKSKRVEKPVFHCSIALPAGDSLSNSQINDLAVAYMKKMGYGNNPFVVYKHNDTHHSHVHIISSRVGANGRLVNPSFEFKKNLPVCRQLEQEFNIQVISSVKSGKGKVPAMDKEYSMFQPFKINVEQNLEFAVNVRRLPNLADLSQYLLKRNIEMVYNRPDGKRLPRSGVVFYRLSTEGRRESRLKGWAFGKEFGKQLEGRLARNANLIGEENASTGILAASGSAPTYEQAPKLSYQEQLQIAKGLYATYNELTLKVVYTEDEIRTIAARHGVNINVKRNKAGFNGFSIAVNGHEYKPSDFSYNSIKLSTTFLKELLNAPAGIAPLQHTYDVLLQRFQKLTNSESTTDYLNYLNRNGLSIKIIDRQYHVYSLQDPQNAVQIDGHRIPGTDNIRLTVYNHQAKESLDFGQINLYNALLSSNKDALAKISRHPVDFAYHDDEKALQEGILVFQSIVDIQNRLKVSVSRETTTGANQTLKDIINSMNNRGLHLSLEILGDTVKSIIVTDRITGIELNQYSLTNPFNNRHWMQTKIGGENIQTLLQQQIIDTSKATMFNQFERTGIISPEHLQLLLDDIRYRAEVIKISARYQANSGKPESQQRPVADAHRRHVRGENDSHYSRVINHTYFQDPWDSHYKGI